MYIYTNDLSINKKYIRGEGVSSGGSERDASVRTDHRLSARHGSDLRGGQRRWCFLRFKRTWMSLLHAEIGLRDYIVTGNEFRLLFLVSGKQTHPVAP